MFIPFRLSLAAIVFLLCTPAALAGGAAEFETGEGADRGRIVLEFDSGMIRMTPVSAKGAVEAQGYAIFRDGKMYSVAVTDGQTMVVEMGAMMKMMGSRLANASQFNSGLDDIAEYHGLSATGQRETHAGITGEVYTVDYSTRAGKREKTEVVLASNAKLTEMTKAMTSFSEMMTQAMGRKNDTPGGKALEAAFQKKNLGLLRVEQNMRLTRLDSATPSAARFKLPAEPMQMPELPAGMSLSGAGLGGMFGQAAAETDADGNVVTETVDEKVARQKDRVKARADEEVDKASDRTVDKVLDKAFDKIFGR
ncbi:hypothetical protein [Nevskia sp.]|uniref:hypothetical protein n=1 Tax=Nevskia sp. TaxID=1929292 RepID=UPI0025EDE00D|nr:hypothetical protein [Nevskia sp.]